MRAILLGILAAGAIGFVAVRVSAAPVIGAAAISAAQTTNLIQADLLPSKRWRDHRTLRRKKWLPRKVRPAKKVPAPRPTQPK